MKLWDAVMATAVAVGMILAGVELANAADRLTVALPDVSGLSRADAEALATQVAEIDVITSNCEGFEISDGEWTLLTGTGDKLAAQLGLDPASYEQSFYAPAFSLLDDPEACGRIGPSAPALIARLVSMGGGTESTSAEPATEPATEQPADPAAADAEAVEE